MQGNINLVSLIINILFNNRQQQIILHYFSPIHLMQLWINISNLTCFVYFYYPGIFKNLCVLRLRGKVLVGAAGVTCLKKLLDPSPMSNRANASQIQDRTTARQGQSHQGQW